MANQPSLEIVASAFNSWRKNRPSRSGKIPAALRQQTLGLLPLHSKSEITRALRISGSQLKTWQQAEQFVQEDAFQPAEFVALASEPADHSPLLNVRLRCSGGAELSLSGPLSPAHLAAVVQSLQQGKMQ